MLQHRKASRPPPHSRPAAGAGAATRTRWVVALRWLLFLVAAGAMSSAVLLRPPAEREAARAGPHYACPMHRDVVAAGPGECPICGMALEAADSMTRADAANRALAEVVRRRVLPRELCNEAAPAWVDDDGVVIALLYKDTAANLVEGERASFSSTAAPRPTTAVRLSDEAPLAWDPSSSEVRFRREESLPATPDGLRAGEVGWIRFACRAREALTVPGAAVLQSPAGPYVWASADGGAFEKRPVEVGEVLAGAGIAVVVSGLREAERVVAKDAFFFDAEQRLGLRSASTEAAR